jgi:hypothetical protein
MTFRQLVPDPCRYYKDMDPQFCMYHWITDPYPPALFFSGFYLEVN